MQEGGEEMMTKNAVQQIEEAEHKAKEYQALAVEQAKKLLSDAERQGQAALEQAYRNRLPVARYPACVLYITVSRAAARRTGASGSVGSSLAL